MYFNLKLDASSRLIGPKVKEFNSYNLAEIWFSKSFEEVHSIEHEIKMTGFPLFRTDKIP